MENKILILATGNLAKIRELQALLEEVGWLVKSQKEMLGDIEVEENGITLEQNAEIKARFVWEQTGQPSLADDTGLEVDALDGRPGVRSARFAGLGADDRMNRRKLLQELKYITDPAKRTARFRTVLVYLTENGMHRYEGICEGRILHEERGTGGFGYDPVFIPRGFQQSFAEMEPSKKNSISHRGKALRKWLADIGRSDT
ncbi:MAG: RdgB/HAM1 family non-canonical purine NTP pyrophosphatase [Balneolales bacterium]